MSETGDLLAALQASVDHAREGRKPAPASTPDLAFCEPSPATTFSRMHIRVVGSEGRLYGGGIPGPALCGHSRLSWDVEGPPLILAQIEAQPQEGLVGRTCSACAEAATQLLREAAVSQSPEPQTVFLPHPIGRRGQRKLKNLRPGQVIVPPMWAGDSEDGHGTEWAIVTGHPFGMQLENRSTRRKRWEWKVPCRFPHEAASSFALEGDGTEDVPIIVPTKAETARLDAELANLSCPARPVPEEQK